MGEPYLLHDNIIIIIEEMELAAESSVQMSSVAIFASWFTELFK